MKPLLSLFFVATAASLVAGQREVVEGYLTPVSSLNYDYRFTFRPLSDTFLELTAALPVGTQVPTGMGPSRVEVERSLFPANRGVALRLLPSPLLAPAGVPLSPERWAGANTGMHPTLHSNQPFEVSGPTDFDGDGVPDHVDQFPDDPDESSDNDADGAGDNADPDDDNDLMPDAYEVGNGLDPHIADGEADPDNDGYSNTEECAAGTGAQDGASHFRIEAVEFPNPEKIILFWQALPGRRYEVWHRPQLSPRGSKLAEDIRVPEPGLISHAFEAAAWGDFYFIQVIADPP